jgi:hypothetical protein
LLIVFELLLGLALFSPVSDFLQHKRKDISRRNRILLNCLVYRLDVLFMLLLVSSGVPFYFPHIFYSFFVLAEGKQHLLNLSLVVMYVRIHGYVLYDVSFALERVLGCSFRGRNVAGDLRLISASHC